MVTVSLCVCDIRPQIMKLYLISSGTLNIVGGVLRSCRARKTTVWIQHLHVQVVSFPLAAFCVLLDTFLTSRSSHFNGNQSILFIRSAVAEKIKGRRRLVENCADRNLIG